MHQNTVMNMAQLLLPTCGCNSDPEHDGDKQVFRAQINAATLEETLSKESDTSRKGCCFSLLTHLELCMLI